MNYKKITKFISTFIPVLIAGAFIVSPAVVSAQNIVVDFENNPLFNEANFLPGNEVIRVVEVSNKTEVEQRIIVEAVNAEDDGGLGDFLALEISYGPTIVYNDTLGNFLRTGEIYLSNLGANSSTIYSFSVVFDGNADNDTQEAGLGFDLCVGFEGGETNCGSTVVGGEGETTGGEGSSGGGGGGGGIIQFTNLEVFNEEAKNTDEESVTALIEWESNKLSTSQVIYGKASDEPYSLNLTVEPYFGYPLGTVENHIKVTKHSVLLTGLEPGQTYVYRVVSRASPPTVGFQHKFALNEAGEVEESETISTTSIPLGAGTTSVGSEGGNINKLNEPEHVGEGNQAEEKDTQMEGVKDIPPPENEQAAAALFAIPDNFSDLFKCIGLFLLLVALMYIIWNFVKDEESEKSSKGSLRKQRDVFFFVGSIISIAVVYMLGSLCTIIPLSILAAMFLLSYLLNKLKK